MTVRTGLCRTCSEPKLLVFSHRLKLKCLPTCLTARPPAHPPAVHRFDSYPPACPPSNCLPASQPVLDNLDRRAVEWAGWQPTVDRWINMLAGGQADRRLTRMSAVKQAGGQEGKQMVTGGFAGGHVIGYPPACPPANLSAYLLLHQHGLFTLLPTAWPPACPLYRPRVSSPFFSAPCLPVSQHAFPTCLAALILLTRVKLRILHCFTDISQCWILFKR